MMNNFYKHTAKNDLNNNRRVEQKEEKRREKKNCHNLALLHKDYKNGNK